MHMADALISPVVGATMWTATAATTAYCAKRVRENLDQSKIPLMGVLGAFIFAAQMLNFTIPGTGSSGHLGGGLILAILLGPEAAFLVIASVLTVQALFFADGGLLALGANVFNLGVFPAFVAYPLLYRRIVAEKPGAGRVVAGSMAAGVLGVVLGASGVVLETVFSGVSSLPVGAFAGLVLPIHLAIGLVEGAVTAAVVTFVYRAQPDILVRAAEGRGLEGVAVRRVIAALAIAAIVAGGGLAWYASANPDGLEWSIAHVAGPRGVEATGAVKGAASRLQSSTALLPGYGRPARGGARGAAAPAAASGTSIAGLVGAALTLLVAGGVGLALRRRRASGG
jgi:cobalt/nickel transport system permease protein